MADEPHKLQAQILTPEGKVFEGEAFQVSARTVVGEVGIRARHAPMLARLVPHELRIFEDAAEFGERAALTASPPPRAGWRSSPTGSSS